MNSTYPQEYLDSAEDQGYSDFWDGISQPCDTLPSKEKEYWYRGRKKAYDEQMEAMDDDTE